MLKKTNNLTAGGVVGWGTRYHLFLVTKEKHQLQTHDSREPTTCSPSVQALAGTGLLRAVWVGPRVYPEAEPVPRRAGAQACLRASWLWPG